MTIERASGDYDGEITIVCDDCSEPFDADTSSFPEALAAFKEAGGRAVKRGDEWEHLCPDCVDDPI